MRQLTECEIRVAGELAARHGTVRALDQPIPDSIGGTPLIRFSTLAQLERRGVISAREADAGHYFGWLFQQASLDPLKVADIKRIPAAGGPAAGDLPAAAERYRHRVSDAMRVLGGAGSPAASAIWAICGLEMSVPAWALARQRRPDEAFGILCAGLGVLAAHWGARGSGARSIWRRPPADLIDCRQRALKLPAFGISL